MAPTLSTGLGQKVRKYEEVVISGVAGHFPDSDNVEQFKNNLMNGVDLVSDDDRRWRKGNPEIPHRLGKINGLSKFDANFFGVHPKQAHYLDPMARKLMENAYEAVVDAGFNPKSLKGSKCGVFVATSYSETEYALLYDDTLPAGYPVTGISRSLLANRISYWLDVHGPSFTLDSACSSSMTALELGFNSIREGRCDSALVAASNLCLHPIINMHFRRFGAISQDGVPRCLDDTAGGYTRAEAISVVFLQRKQDARRIYCEIVHLKANTDGFKESGLNFPSSELQFQLMKELYQECQIDPRSVHYVEAHATATKAGDPQECGAIDKIFCTGRDSPLLIGTVKSNLGHTEAVSGLCSVTKAIIAFETGFIPPNINFKTPNSKIDGLTSGRMKVVTEKTPLPGDLIAVNNFGFGGSNCHAILRRHNKAKEIPTWTENDLPVLVPVSGRTQEAVDTILDHLESNHVDAEFCKLLHDIYSENIPAHTYRGFTVVPPQGKPTRHVQYYSEEKPSVWFVYSGMGSHWTSMGKSLMSIPVFAQSIQNCHEILLNKGIDLIKVLTEDNPKMFENIINTIVGIVSVQIGLTDVLHSLGVYPDNIIGHSIGELGCAYADGCMTSKQMILSAYYRGLAITETAVTLGAMAAVGKGYKDIHKTIPPDVEVACHNGPDSCTISGEVVAVKSYISKLTASGVFAKEVSVAGIPYHSKYIAPVATRLLQYLQKVIPFSKKRSPRWISSSIPESSWENELSQVSSPEYHTNNLVSPVLFEEASRHIPANALAIEIAPCGLLQAILKRSLHKSVINVPLTERGNVHDNVKFCLSAIGRVYEAGVQPQVARLYPSVEYPVSRGTPMLSPLVRWNHADDWYTYNYEAEHGRSGERKVVVSLADDAQVYLKGHAVSGRVLYPAAGYMFLVWESLAKLNDTTVDELPVVFENVKFIRATHLSDAVKTIFMVRVSQSSGHFEIVEGETTVATGNVLRVDNTDEHMTDLGPIKAKTQVLSFDDVYKETELMGYNYGGLFKSINALDCAAGAGEMRWNGNWIPFLDGVIQVEVVLSDSRNPHVPVYIDKLVVDPKLHFTSLQHESGVSVVPLYLDKHLQTVQTPGVEMRGLKLAKIQKNKVSDNEMVLEEIVFVPFIGKPLQTRKLQLARDIMQIWLQYLSNTGSKCNIIELFDGQRQPLAPQFLQAYDDLPLIEGTVSLLYKGSSKLVDSLPSKIIVKKHDRIWDEEKSHIIVAPNVLKNTDLLQKSLGVLIETGYLVAREDPQDKINMDGLNVIFDQEVDGERIVILTKVPKISMAPAVVKITNYENFEWITVVKKLYMDLKVPDILLVAEKDFSTGLLGFIKCLRKEVDGDRVRCVIILDEKAPSFELSNPFYQQQLRKRLPINIYKDGCWGDYLFHRLPNQPGMRSVQHAFIMATHKGDLSSLKLVQGPFHKRKNTPPLVRVYYAAINFKDVLHASGKLQSYIKYENRLKVDTKLGLEFCGRDESGHRVFGLIEQGGLSSLLDERECLVWPVPDGWSLKEAATIPMTYGTVFLGFIANGKLKRGDSVLIHCGAGGVGMAAIHVALSMDCKVFTTVSTPDKTNFIQNNFPQIPMSHIFNSKDSSFETQIMRETNGRGVNIILNSLAGEKMEASIRCLAKFGCFVEMGKFDVFNDRPFDIQNLKDGTNFEIVTFDTIFLSKESRREFHKGFGEFLKSKCVKPLPYTTFDFTKPEEAFRYMIRRTHMGKVLLKIRDEESQKVIVPAPKKIDALERVFWSAHGSYLILGGLGGFGLELADLMVLRGARNIVLSGRKGITSGYQAERVRIWRSYGANIVISTHKIDTLEGITALIEEAAALGPVLGVYNLAMSSLDMSFRDQEPEYFSVACETKSTTTEILDKVTREKCPHLENFVGFSSITSGRGHFMQTSYGYANSAMERICEKRYREGYPAQAILWGPIANVGILADLQKTRKMRNGKERHIVIQGSQQQPIDSCLLALEVLMNQQEPILSSLEIHKQEKSESADLSMVDEVLKIIGIKDIKSVSLSLTFPELGVDSMVVVELKQALLKFQVVMTPQDIRKLTFGKLLKMQESLKIEKTNSSGIVGNQSSVKKELSEEEEALLATVPMGPNISPGERPIFLVPGIDGMASLFLDLAQNLNTSAICLQYPIAQANTPMSWVASELFKNMKPFLQAEDKKFTVVTNHTGCFVGLEIARSLEQEGREGVVVLVGGTPASTQENMEVMLEDRSDSGLVNLMFYHFLNERLKKKIKDDEVKKVLAGPKSFDEKLQFLIAFMPESIRPELEFAKILTSDLLKRIHGMVDYKFDTKKKLKSKIILIKPSQPVCESKLPDDLCLSQYSQQSGEVHVVEGSVHTIIDSPATANVIKQAFQKYA